jgi:YhcH/YjgK/YiaL family protein
MNKKNFQPIEPDQPGADSPGLKHKIQIQGKEVILHLSADITKLQEQIDKNPGIWETMFRLLEATEFSRLDPGRVEVMGENLFYLVNQYVTKEAESVKFEAHRKYIDLQYVMEGEEMMGVSGFEYATETETYIAEKDIAFYTVSKAEYHTATPSAFFVFFPEDLHQPGVMVMDPREVRKVVFKILIK